MSESRVEAILGDAASLERRYEWLETVDLYGQALSVVDEEDYLRRGEIQEKLGHSLHRAAFQAGSREEFRERMQCAIEAYEKGYGIYEKLADERGAPWMFRCRAISRDLSHWLVSDPSEKRRLLDECLEFEERALEAFWDLGDKMDYGRTYNKIPLAVWNRLNLEWNRQVHRRILEKEISWGEKAVKVLSKLAYPIEIARSKYTSALYVMRFNNWFVAEPEKREQHRLKDIERFQEVVELSERVGDTYLVGLTHWIWGWQTGGNERIQHLRKVLKCGEETRDILLKGIAHDSLAYSTYWKAIATDDPDQRNKLVEEAMEFYDEGQRYFSLMSCLFRFKSIILAPGGYTEHYFFRAGWETNVENKLGFLDKAEKEGLKALKIAENLDIPIIIDRMCHFLSKTLCARAMLEPDVDVKRSLLERAMKYRERNIEIEERLVPFDHWNLGVWYHYLALIKMEYADIELDLESKRNLLQDAALSMEKSLESINKTMTSIEKRGSIDQYAGLTRFQDNYELILTRLYEVTNESEHLRRAIEISRKAIESAIKVEMLSRIAESYWKIARKHDILGEQLEAADSFKRASENYVKSAEKIPQLRDFYQDYVTYMVAWSEIERARHHHKEKKYGMAKECYKKAAELHETTKRWGYLSPNYLAWARLEEAEDLSRTEQTQEARDIFQQAARLFEEAKESISTKLKTIETREERQTAEGLIKASDVRREYCLGRIALEEARILDRQGEHATSSTRYGQAFVKFQKVIDSVERESDKIEIWPIVYLSQAWQKMMMAEARTSPGLYDEAAELFEQARMHATDQSTSLLAQAHSSFCRALEAGTRYELTRKDDSFSEAKRYIEAATSHYLRAGYRTMSDYAGATSRLLDAYLYSYNAQTEADPKKKAQFYQMAERLLQSSAGAYLKAKHPEKSEEVRRILERVKEEREIAVSLSEVLHAPAIVSTTTSFSTPTPTHEQAVGLERFEYADIQANLIIGEREVNMGEDIDLEIALVNAGRAPAQLIKVDDIIPEGFEVKRAPDIYRIEDSYIDMKGRTLSPLKTEELKLTLRPLNKGTFHLKPRVLYLDESNKYKFHETEPATVKVRVPRLRGPPI